MKEMIMSSSEIQDVVSHLGHLLTAELQNEEKRPILLCVMKGAVNFMTDLIKHVHTPILTDYIQVSSYDGTSSTGNVTLVKKPAYDPEGRTVVIVEDVIDTGLSMKWLINYLKTQFKPKRVLVCALFNKTAARKVDVQVDFCGITLPENKFLVGYGFDYNELHRNDPFIFVPTEEEIKAWDKIIENDPVKPYKG